MTTMQPPKAGFQRYVALAMITLLLALSTADRATLSVAGPNMSKALGISAIQMGWLFSVFAWAYVIFMIPAGWFVDRVGAKKGILLGLLTWSCATFLMGTVGGMPAAMVLGTLLALRFLLGMFETPVGPASGRVLASWFPASERGVAGSIFNSAQYVSLVLFTPLMGWLDHTYGWHAIYTVMGGLGLALAFVWLSLFHMPNKHPRVSQGELDYIKASGALIDLDNQAAAVKTKKQGSTLKDIKTLFKSRMLCGIFIGQYCVTAITWFFVSWFPAYLVKELGLSILKAGFIAAIPAICGFIGGVSAGFVSDTILKKTGNLTLARKVPITIGLLMSAMIVGCNYAGGNITIVVALMSAAFFGKGFGNLGWTIVADTAPKEIVGLTGGLFNAIGNSSGIVTPLVIGYILAATGSFHGALAYVGAHGLVAIASYWIIVGKIERVQLKPESTESNLAVQASKA